MLFARTYKGERCALGFALLSFRLLLAHVSGDRIPASALTHAVFTEEAVCLRNIEKVWILIISSLEVSR